MLSFRRSRSILVVATLGLVGLIAAIGLMTGNGRTVQAQNSAPSVEIERKQSEVTEGQEIRFELKASNAPSSSIQVNVSVTEDGSFLAGTPTSVITISAGQDKSYLILQTSDDAVVEDHGSVSATIVGGAGYSVGSDARDSVDVKDNDPKVAITTTMAGTDSVLLNWTLTPNVSGQIQKIKWERTDSHCGLFGFLTCDDGTINVASSTQTQDIVPNLKLDKNYEFKLEVEITVSGEKRKAESPPIEVRTHPAPDINAVRVDGTLLGAAISLTSAEMGVMTSVGIVVNATSAPATYQFALEAPSGTGFRIANASNGSCSWPLVGTQTSAGWKTQVQEIYLMRCALGDDSSKLRVKARDTGTGLSMTYYDVLVGRSWHQSDHTVKYALGTMLPTPTPPPVGPPAPPIIDVPGAITTAITKWKSSGANVAFCEGDLCGSKNKDGYTITINVEESSPGIINTACGNSYACTFNTGSSSYPHVRNQRLAIEEPPYDGNNKKRWTNMQALIGTLNYYYLPSTMMHELGHSAGLGHSPVGPVGGVGGDVMEFPPDQRTLSQNDEDAMNANYAGHSSHR